MNGVYCLNRDGIITDRSAIMESLFIYWLCSSTMDSTIFTDTIASASFDMAQTDNIEDSLVAIQETLRSLYSSYFDSVVVDTTTTEEDGVVYITVNVKAVYEKQTYELKKILEYSNLNKTVDIMQNIQRLKRM